MRDGETKLDFRWNWKLNCIFEEPKCEGQHKLKVNWSEYYMNLQKIKAVDLIILLKGWFDLIISLIKDLIMFKN